MKLTELDERPIDGHAPRRRWFCAGPSDPPDSVCFSTYAIRFEAIRSVEVVVTKYTTPEYQLKVYMGTVCHWIPCDGLEQLDGYLEQLGLKRVE